MSKWVEKIDSVLTEANISFDSVVLRGVFSKGRLHSSMWCPKTDEKLEDGYLSWAQIRENPCSKDCVSKMFFEESSHPVVKALSVRAFGSGEEDFESGLRELSKAASLFERLNEEKIDFKSFFRTATSHISLKYGSSDKLALVLSGLVETLSRERREEIMNQLVAYSTSKVIQSSLSSLPSFWEEHGGEAYEVFKNHVTNGLKNSKKIYFIESYGLRHGFHLLVYALNKPNGAAVSGKQKAVLFNLPEPVAFALASTFNHPVHLLEEPVDSQTTEILKSLLDEPNFKDKTVSELLETAQSF